MGNLFGFDILRTIFDEDHSHANMLKIKRVVYNNPYTIVYWTDGSNTRVKTVGGDKFNKEIGLQTAITRKYFEQLGSKTVRKDIKDLIKNAEDYSKEN